MGSDMLNTVRFKHSESCAKGSQSDLIHRLGQHNDGHDSAADIVSGRTTPISSNHIGPEEKDDGSDSTVTPTNTPEAQWQYPSAAKKSSHQEATPAIILSLSQALIALPCHYALAVTNQLLDLVDHALEHTGQGVEYAKGLSKNTRAYLPKKLQESIQSFHALADQAIAMMPCCQRHKRSR